jgi:hypothetical protein
MFEQITALGALDDEIVRTCKWYETSLDLLVALEKGHERTFEKLREVVSSVEDKRKLLRKGKDALLKLEGYLQAQGPSIAKIISQSSNDLVGNFFEAALGRAQQDAATLVAAMSTEIKLDLGLLSRILDHFPEVLGADGWLRVWRKSFEERTEHVEQQGEQLVRVTKVVERTLDKTISKLVEGLVPAASPAPSEDASPSRAETTAP